MLQCMSLLLAQSRHPDRVGECPLSGQSGRPVALSPCPLLTQSGHLASVLPTGVRGYFDIEVKSSFLPAQRFIERDSWAVLRVRLHKNNVHIPL
jgi:hypothetical protein